MANGPQNAPGTGTAPSPCKIAADPSGQYDFQTRKDDMPLNLKLCENHQGSPATTSQFNTNGGTQIYPFGSATAISGQPTSVTAQKLSMTLPVGAYNIVMVVDPKPKSTAAYVFEDCGASNPLAIIQTNLQQPSGSFTLRVV